MGNRDWLWIPKLFEALAVFVSNQRSTARKAIKESIQSFLSPFVVFETDSSAFGFVTTLKIMKTSQDFPVHQIISLNRPSMPAILPFHRKRADGSIWRSYTSAEPLANATKI
jgi:hypothetical protein